MKIGLWAGLMAAAALMAGCGDFWQAPSTSTTTGFSLSSSPTSITVASGGGTGTSDITVTPGSSFTGTVTLSCAVTTQLSNPVSPTTCSLSSSSLTFSSTATQTSTLTATTTATTTPGAYDITVTGVSGTVAGTATVCVEVGTGTCTTTSSTSGNFYILNSTEISGYSISSGTVSPLSGSPTPLTAGAIPSSMAVDPTGHFLYVGTNGGIYLYDIQSDGSLKLDSNTLLNDGTSNALSVDSSGYWLLDASNTTGQPTLYAWPISKTNGESTLGSAVNVPTQPLVSGGNVAFGGMAISPDNKLVAVAAGSATQTFTFSAGSGGNGSTSPFTGTVTKTTTTGTAVSVAFNPGTNFLFIGETGDFTSSGGLRIIPITGDVLGTEPSASPYPSGGTGPHAILADSNGYVYVANWASTSPNITAFKLDAAASTLTLQSNPATTGGDPYGMILDNTGDFVLVVNNQGTTPFDAYTFDATTTGLLDPVSLTGSAPSSPIAIVAVPK